VSKSILNMIAIPVRNQRALMEQIISFETSESNHLSLGAQVYVYALISTLSVPCLKRKELTLSIYHLNDNELNEFHLTSELQSKLPFIYSFKGLGTNLTLLTMSQIYGE